MSPADDKTQTMHQATPLSGADAFSSGGADYLGAGFLLDPGLAALVMQNTVAADPQAEALQAETSEASSLNASLSEETAMIQSMVVHTTGQWHLQAGSGYDINVLKAWEDYTGDGVTVGVVDSGVQYTHHELSANYNANIDYDMLTATADGSPKNSGDNHGTAVAGNIAAANNGTGSTGVAFDATITSFRLVSNVGIFASQIADALSRNVDISNNSWGWTQPFAAPSFTSTIETAMQTAVSNNRGGLGTVLVFAAGNSGADGDNVNYSEMGNSRFSIKVAAANQDGTIASFSTPGTPILVSAPGTSIYTTDITGAGGYNAASDYATLQGTSFAAPIVSGVVALMLEANPGLGYRDVQEILAYSARQTHAASPLWDYNGATNWNGGGMHVHESFGYGFVDATAAVRLAESWFLTGDVAAKYSNETRATYTSSTLNASFDNTTFTTTLNVATGIEIDHIEVQLNLTHNFMQDLTIKLTSPDGTESLLVSRPPSATSATMTYIPSWTLSSTHNWGESGQGTWTLSIQDHATGNSGFLQNWTLKLFGDAASNNDTYIYTNEYASFTGGGNAARRTLTDSAGIDTINAAAVTGNSTIDLRAGNNSTIAGNTLTIASGTTIEHAIGGDGDDTITGNSSANKLIGGRGNDILDGGAGIDTLIGGEGDDIYYVDSLSDIVIENAGEGYDIIYSSLANYVLSANVERLEIIGGGNVTGTENVDNLHGSDDDNTITALGGNDLLFGKGGNDTLDGGDGNDYLDGGTGNDTMIGGAGDDKYIVDSASDVVTENANEGSDTVQSFITYTLPNNVEILRIQGTANFNGTGNALDNAIFGNSGNNSLIGNDGNDYLFGDAGNDTLYGGNGNDKLEGGAGVDNMQGGAGDDTYYVDDSSDSILELSNQGTDTVFSSVSYALANHVEKLYLTGSGDINGTGNGFHNALYGNSGVNVLEGGGGNDILDGGAGDDTLIGGAGDDIYYVDSLNDVITENANEGYDVVYSTVANYVLSANVEVLQVAGSGNFNVTGTALADNLKGNTGQNIINGMDGDDALYGFAGNDTLNGGNGNDLLDGGTGVDTMAGGDGNDVYVVDDSSDVVTENAGEGQDTVMAYATYTITDHIEIVRLQGTGNIGATGNAQNNNLLGNSGNNALIGGDGDDYLFGDAGNDSLLGGNGNDKLDGGTGNDNMTGGLGDDLYYIDSTLDTIAELAGEGNDTVFTTTNFTLSANLEQLVLQGTGNINGTGNNDDNNIFGNSGNNILNGSGGNDTIRGQDGNDTLIGGAGSDYLLGGNGNDTYTGYSGSFGVDHISDASGAADLIDLSAYNSSAASWYAVDSNGDARVDQLILTFAGGNALKIYNYFNNSNADDDLSAAGAGYIETIAFQNATFHFADVQAIIA